MYDHKAIEAKWIERWEANPIVAKDGAPNKTYLLIEFPFPSGDGLHVGHARGYTAMDIVARKRRRQGENVLYPIGWDAFGLPTENYAIKMGRNPADVTKENTNIFRRQMKQLGFTFDWSREVNTTDPKFYKWTQWIFLKLYEHGLAYKAKSAINWCPKDKIGLANEEVVDGACERCGTPVEKREREQWMLAITKYARRLYDDLDTVDYIERAKAGQRNWIGPSEGAEISFQVLGVGGGKHEVTVFTTRPDTLFGATYMVLAPEHPVVAKLTDTLTNKDEVSAYIEEARKKDEIARTDATKEKTGILLEGVTSINPANKEAIPVFIADYVLASYGTGAIMAVPAHDERDHEFARKFDLPIRKVVAGEPEEGEVCYTGEGDLVDSGDFTGLPSTEAKKKITDFVKGNWTTKYKLRDWVFSRQRYWGEPIPMVHCEQCGWVPVPEDQLPVELPHVEHYEPTETGDSPLATIDEWVNTTCPTCGGVAKRETDVMPNWAGSSWYYIAYCISENLKSQAPITKQIQSTEIQNKFKYWLPVDWYNGGMEHTTLHLLYSRFWHKFLYDIKVVPTPEPYAKRTSHGFILAEGGDKMSKSKGNVINPDDIIDRFGADALRVYEMFMGPFDQEIAWSTDGLVGVRRFLERVVKLSSKADEASEVPTPTQGVGSGPRPLVEDESVGANSLEILMHQTIKKVGDDIEDFHLNTAVSQLMIFANALEKEDAVSRHAYETLVVLLAPFAPFVAEELWEALGNEGSIHEAPWPSFDPEKLVGSEVTIAVQVNGKVRGTVSCAPGTPEATVLALARADKKTSSWIERGTIDKVFYVPDRLINIVVKGA